MQSNCDTPEAILKTLDQVFLDATNALYSSVFSDARMWLPHGSKTAEQIQLSHHKPGLKGGDPGQLLAQV